MLHNVDKSKSNFFINNRPNMLHNVEETKSKLALKIASIPN